MGNSVKVSILIPIYNVEKYLCECLESVINQTLKDIEIICINDGSTDGSLEIIRKYMQQDSRVLLIDKANSGYGDSMNQGLIKAKGQYIGIVESDDIAQENMFETLYYQAQKYLFPDIVKSNYYDYWSTTNTKHFHENFAGLTYDALFMPLKNDAVFKTTPSIWSGIYKNEFIKHYGIAFNNTPGASYQDTSFYFMLLALAESMVCIKEAFLLYRQDNENSSINSVDKIFCVSDEYRRIENFIDNQFAGDTKIQVIKNIKKFSIYMWNYNRLDNKFKSDFFSRMQAEFLEAYVNNLLNKDGFTPENWILLQNVLHSEDDLKRAQQEIREKRLEPYLQQLQKKIGTLLQDEDIILYGFNDLARLFCKRGKYTVKTILDSKKFGDNYGQIPIVRLDDLGSYEGEVFVITAVNENFIQEIKEKILSRYPDAKTISPT